MRPDRGSIPKWIPIVIFCAALIGFADSAYLTAQHVLGFVPPCTLKGCEVVLASLYSQVGPVPLAALGLIYYGLVLVLLVAYLDSWNRRFLHIAAWVVSAGFLATLYLLYLQFFVIHAVCQYCLLSALMTFTLFGVSLRLMYSD